MAKTSASIIKPIKPIPNMPEITRDVGDGSYIFNKTPTQANPKHDKNANINESAHLRLVVGRNEIFQHFNAPARRRIKKISWPTK